MKKLLIVLFIALAILGTGCTEKQEISTVEAYFTVINKLYQEDTGLNHGIKYIAVDTSLMVNLNDEEREELLGKVKNYGFEVLNMTFEELEKQGYIEDLYFKDGILFRIEDKPIKNNTIKIMKASKWRSGLGAIGMDDLTIKFKKGQWKITRIGALWIS